MFCAVLSSSKSSHRISQDVCMEANSGYISLEYEALHFQCCTDRGPDAGYYVPCKDEERDEDRESSSGIID